MSLLAFINDALMAIFFFSIGLEIKRIEEQEPDYSAYAEIENLALDSEYRAEKEQAEHYFEFWDQEVRLQLGDFNFFSHNGHPMSLLAFINDALMAIFFFSRSKKQIFLPSPSSGAG